MFTPNTAITAGRQALGAVAVCGLLLFTLSGCQDETVTAAVLPTVYTEQVRLQPSVQTRRISATVQPRYESQLAFRVSGKIERRLIELGQQVRANQLLMQLDEQDYRLSLAAAQQEWQAAQAEATLADNDARRGVRIFAKALLGRSELERLQSRAAAAQARLQQAAERLRLAENQLQYTGLRSPMTGVVTALQAEQGQVVREGQGVLTVADPAQLDLVADIPETLRTQLQQLQASASLLVAGKQQQVQLRLREMAPKASERARTFRARFALADAGQHAAGPAAIAMGSSAQLSLSAALPQLVADLPAAALLSTHSGATVWVVQAPSGELTRRPVTIVTQSAERVQLSGLQAGELVVVVGAHKLDTQLKVQPVPLPLDKFQEAD